MITWSGNCILLLFEKICHKWGTPDIDLFANRLNCKVTRYCSWKPDPGAVAIDALTEDWSGKFFYAFPPFNMIGRVLRKVENDKAEGILVVPFWPTQHWFSKFSRMCTNTPAVLFSRDAQPTLSHPWRGEDHLPRTRLLAAPISAHLSMDYPSATTSDAFYLLPGDQGHISSMGDTSKNGVSFVVGGVLTQCHPI